MINFLRKFIKNIWRRNNMGAFVPDEENETFISFRKFILSEAILPKQTEFGTDMKNETWLRFKNITVTFFKHNDMFYNISIDLDSNDVGFGSSDKFPENFKYKTIQEYFTTTRKHSLENASVIFNKVFYVILIGAKKYNIPEVIFQGDNPELRSFYDHLMENTLFLKRMKTEGYEFVRKLGRFYIFERI